MYNQLSVSLDNGILWCFMKPLWFTRGLLADLGVMQETQARDPDVKAFVLGSHNPAFSFGGDLELFIDRIRQGDRDSLRSYAHTCVALGYENYLGYGHNVVTIAMVQGDALGGGWEAALTCDVIVAEHQANFRFPEDDFGLFPGMGAFTYLARRVGAHKAEQLMRLRTFSAREMCDLGVVDNLAEPGDGKANVQRNINYWLGRAPVYEARRRVNQITLPELLDIADIWVETALRLKESNLRKMSYVAAAQRRGREII